MKILSLLILLSTCTIAHAQKLTSTGREFWLGFMPNGTAPAMTVSLKITSPYNNTILIDRFDDDGQVISTKILKVLGNRAYTVSLSVDSSETRQPERAAYRAVRVTGSAPLTVLATSNGEGTYGSYLALPLEAYGKEYYCFSYFDDAYDPGQDRLSGEFMVIAPYDSTLVTIKTACNTTSSLDGKTIGHSEGSTWSALLMKGQTYLVQSTGFRYGVDDLTGSRITSNKPIAFLSGHQRAGIELGGSSASKDHLIEMILPTELWGTSYAVLPSGRNTEGDYIRILSAEDGNSLSRNGSLFHLNAGDWTDVSAASGPLEFHSLNGKRFMTMQYHHKANAYGNGGTGDVDMISAVPFHQYVNHAYFGTPNAIGSTAMIHTSTWYVAPGGFDSIMVHSGAGSRRRLSSMGISGNSSFQGDDLHATRLVLSGGEISLFATSSIPFSVMLSGTSNFESYGAPVATGLRMLFDDTTPPQLTLTEASCGEFRFTATDVTEIAIADLVFDTLGSGLATAARNYVVTKDPSFVLGDTLVKFTARPIDTSKVGTAAIRVIDRAGNAAYAYYTYEPSVPIIESETNLRTLSSRVYDTLVVSTIVHNRTNRPWTVLDLSIEGDASFTILGEPTRALDAGDSTEVEVQFIGSDTSSHTAHLVAAVDCGMNQVELMARARAPQFIANDLNLKRLELGIEKCGNIRLENLSEVDITVTSISTSPNIKVTTNDLPWLIRARSNRTVPVCLTLSQYGDFTGVINYALDNKWPETKDSSMVIGFAREDLSVEGNAYPELSLYPTPAVDKLHVDGVPSGETFMFTITDASGRNVRSGSPLTGTVELAGLPSGAYRLHIEGDDMRWSSPFVIKR